MLDRLSALPAAVLKVQFTNTPFSGDLCCCACGITETTDHILLFYEQEFWISPIWSKYQLAVKPQVVSFLLADVSPSVT